jgi:hypothetical protein
VGLTVDEARDDGPTGRVELARPWCHPSHPLGGADARDATVLHQDGLPLWPDGLHRQEAGVDEGEGLVHGAVARSAVGVPLGRGAGVDGGS